MTNMRVGTCELKIKIKRVFASGKRRRDHHCDRARQDHWTDRTGQANIGKAT